MSTILGQFLPGMIGIKANVWNHPNWNKGEYQNHNAEEADVSELLLEDYRQKDEVDDDCIPLGMSAFTHGEGLAEELINFLAKEDDIAHQEESICSHKQSWDPGSRLLAVKLDRKITYINDLVIFKSVSRLDQQVHAVQVDRNDVNESN